MTKTLFIVNPHAGKSRAGKMWQKLEPELRGLFPDMLSVITQSTADIDDVIQSAVAQGARQVITVGGDGTNHAVLNSLMHFNAQHPDDELTYGTLPAGTGRDFARGAGLPLDASKAARHLASATPRRIDIGEIAFDGERRYFLNVSSAGLSNEVVQRVERARRRRPWTFLRAAVETLLKYDAERMVIETDGETWFEGDAFLVAVANGTTFAQGMRVAPDARLDDGLFHVVLVRKLSRFALFRALPRVYFGAHVNHSAIKITTASQLTIHDYGRMIGLDMDGEGAQGRNLTYTLHPAALRILL